MRPQMIQTGSNSGQVGISSLPAEAFRSVFGPGKLRYLDTARIVGRGGSMIRHAPQTAAFPVGPLPVAVIEPAFPTLLVPPVGVPPLAPPRFPPAALAAVLVPPGHNDDRSRTSRHSRPPGRTAAAGALRRSPSPPFRREGTTATRHGNLDPIRRCPFTLLGAERAPLLSGEHGRIRHGAQTGRLGSHRGSHLSSGRAGKGAPRRHAPGGSPLHPGFDQVNQLVSGPAKRTRISASWRG